MYMNLERMDKGNREKSKIWVFIKVVRSRPMKAQDNKT